MASVFHLCCNAFKIKESIVTKYSEYVTNEKILFFSAVAIQRTWRGYAARKTIRNWNQKATLIQKFVRGWLLRLHLPELLKAHYERVTVRYYEQQATKIQAMWRGFYVRKYEVCIKAILAARADVEMASKEMQSLVNSLFKKLQENEWNKSRQCTKEVLKILFDRHHLLRTQTKEGIFSIHGSKEFSRIERIMKKFQFLEYMKELKNMNQQNTVAQTFTQKSSHRFNLDTTIPRKPYEKNLF